MLTTTLLKGTTTDVLYTDFRKAFDNVFHKIFLTKISGVSINGVILDWLKVFFIKKKTKSSDG